MFTFSNESVYVWTGPNTRVWVRVFKHGKFPTKSVLKFALLLQSYYFMKETRNGFCVFEYCDSNTYYVAGLSNSF